MTKSRFTHLIRVCIMALAAGFWASLICLMLALVASPLLAQEAEGVKTAFINDAPVSWEQYHTFALTLQGSMDTKTILYSPEGKETYKESAHIEVKQSTQGTYWMWDASETASREVRVYIGNSRYAAELSHVPGKSDWLLKNLDMNRRGGVFNRKSGQELIDSYVMAQYEIELFPLPKLVKDPRFKLTGIKAAPEGDHKYVSIQFDFSHPVSDKPFVPLQGGTLILDPEAYWSIVEYDLATAAGGGTGKSSGAFQLKKSASGMPVVARHASKSSSTGGKGEWLFDFHLEAASKLPDEAVFTLSAFDLPEPVGVAWKKPTPVYVWVLGAAGICVLLMFVFGWLARRRRTQARLRA